MTKRALITGITGQDGSYLAEQLLRDGYEVHGMIRRSSTFGTSRMAHLMPEVTGIPSGAITHYGDITSATSLMHLLLDIRPTHIFHLAAQSHVRVSFDVPEYTTEVIAMGTIRLFECVRACKIDCRIYQASSSEMFGNSPPPQNELTPLQPRSPYAAAKVFAHHVAKHYREAFGLFVGIGILFNHESPRRGETFVTRKVTRAIARIVNGEQEELVLGNLKARRDWGHARDYVDAMIRIIDHHTPDDFVIGSGISHSVEEFVEVAFAVVGLNWRDYVRYSAKYERPTEIDALQADASKARELLNWKPTVGFYDLVEEMVRSDLAAYGTDTAWLLQRRAG